MQRTVTSSARERSTDALDIKMHVAVDERCAAIGIDRLAGNEACLVGAQECHGVAYIGRRAHAAEWRPAALVPGLNPLAPRFRQRVHDAVVNSIWTHRIH